MPTTDYIHALHGVDVDGAGRRSGHPDRGQRRRQVDADDGDLSASRAHRADASSSTAKTSPSLPTHEIARRGIALVPEGRRIFPRMTVMENLQMGAVLGEEMNFAVDLKRMYLLFPILEERCQQRAGTLSGGEQQMLAIARALMSRPQLLLLDEPSLGLAPLYIKKIFQIVRELNREHGMTILLVEQNAHHALRVAHRGYVLQHGQIILSGTGHELLANPEVHAAYLEGGQAATAS
jgi:branched-chain amino acid transport system ATP-binding protein